MTSSGVGKGTTLGALAGYQNGVVLSTDLAISAISITAGTGALAFTLAATAVCAFVKTAGGVLTAVAFAGGAQTPAALTPATPNYAVVGVEIDTNGAIALVKGADTATQINTGSLIASNTPATTAGRLRLFDFAIQNNAGSFRFGDQTTVASQGVNWIDRRPWARGAKFLINRVGAANYTTSSASMVAIDSTNLAARVECTGNVMQIRMFGLSSNAGTGGFNSFGLFMDGAQVGATQTGISFTAGFNIPCVLMEHEITPTAGSHLFVPNWLVGTGTGTLSNTGATQPVDFTVEEVARQNSSNGTA